MICHLWSIIGSSGKPIENHRPGVSGIFASIVRKSNNQGLKKEKNDKNK